MSLLFEMSKYAEEHGSDVIWKYRDLEVHSEILDHTRWSVVNFAVFERDGEFVGVEYDVPATEYQDEDESMVDVFPVHPREVVKTVYQKMAQ